MTHSVRKSTCNGLGLLERYRKFSRTWPQGSARETASGFWIVSLPNVSLDVARDEKQARAMLEAFQGEY